MIYKFSDDVTDLEFDLAQEEGKADCLRIAIREINDSEYVPWVQINLSKQDVYKLIGALHLIQKEL